MVEVRLASDDALARSHANRTAVIGISITSSQATRKAKSKISVFKMIHYLQGCSDRRVACTQRMLSC